jgi:hypothetical protein
MLFKRVSRSQAETIFVVVKNVSGSTLTAGYSCVFDVGASVDGVRVSQSDTVDLQAYAGVADSSIADSAYGLVQVYGYRASAYIYSSTGSSTAGDNLTVVNSDWGLTPATSGGATKAWGFLCEAITASSSSQFHTTAKVFIRAL